MAKNKNKNKNKRKNKIKSPKKEIRYPISLNCRWCPSYWIIF